MQEVYCPRDQKVYIDLSFYRNLKTQYQAFEDFAQAYVIAHEIGHHVQNLLGISQQVQTLQKQVNFWKRDSDRKVYFNIRKTIWLFITKSLSKGTGLRLATSR